MKPTIDERLQPIITEMLEGGLTLRQALNEFEKKYVQKAIAMRGGRISGAARLLGIHRNSLHNRVKAPDHRRLLALRGTKARWNR